MRSTHTRIDAVGLTVVVAMMCSMPWVAVADDQADVIAERVSEAAVIATPRPTGGPEQAVRLSGVEGLDVPVELPEEFNVSPGCVANDGSTVYLGVANSPDVSVEEVPGGVRISTVIENAAQETTFTYPVGDLVPELDEDGSVILSRWEELPDVGQVLARVGRIAAPWAVDASGSQVPTRFEVVEGKVRQVVETDSATVYPVVADPEVHHYWWGISVDFSRSETKKIAIGGSVCASVLSSIGIAGKVAGAFCSTYSVLAVHAMSERKCISSRFVGFGLGVNFFPWIRKCSS